MYKDINISFISSYLPRQCGIATFTNDLANSITKLLGKDLSEDDSVQVTALNNNTEGYKYSPEVTFEIKDQQLNDYKEAAYFLNLSSSEVVNLQHEFGLYGGESGSNILSLIQHLKKPLITTLHTIPGNPTEDQRKIIKEIGAISTYVVVQSLRSTKMLQKIYNLPQHKIHHISHGAPDVPFLDTSYYKDKFQLSDKKVIFTFGLLGPGKGIEYALEALPEVVRKYPDTTFVILGATHPNVLKEQGEEYRIKLENIVYKNSLQDNVLFINRFVDAKQLLEFLLMSDIYISSYEHKEQIVSGTLTYAMACGKAIISTPYWYAEEQLSDDTGILVNFRDSKSICKAMMEMLGNETKRNRMRKNAYDKGREMVWSRIGSKYYDVFLKAREEFKFAKIASILKGRTKLTTFPSLPEINLLHLRNLTDSTGILQHATYTIQNRNDGYCLDDNARALFAVILNKLLFNDNSILPLINTYLSFILHSFNNETGLFRNFLSYDRRWLEEAGSEESNSQAVFVLGYIIKNPPDDSTLQIAKSLFDKTIVQMQNFKSPRALALIIMGCIFYLKVFSGARTVRKICRTFTEKLSELYSRVSDVNWNWYEEIVTYNNARIPQAQIMAGKFFKSKTIIAEGIEAISWLYDMIYNKDKNYISLIGNNGWLVKGKLKAKYDQQPVEIPALIDACYQVYKEKQNKEWIDKINVLFSWFLGNNDRREMLYDYHTGGCYDGLSSSVINQNQGAESTVSWLLALERMHRIRRDLRIE